MKVPSPWLTSLLGHCGWFYGAEKDWIRDLYPREDQSGLFLCFLSGHIVAAGPTGCGCCWSLGWYDGVPCDGLKGSQQSWVTFLNENTLHIEWCVEPDLLQPHSQGNVSCCHWGNFYMLISKWHHESTHPLPTHHWRKCIAFWVRINWACQLKHRWEGVMETAYTLFLLMLWTAVWGFRQPE